MNDSGSERDPIEILAAEFVERHRRGEHPTIAEYAADHPDLAEEIQDLFPTIAAMERLKIDNECSSGGRASLKGVQLERLGDFRIIREIGRGGMGIVYEAEQESLRRRVAVKVLPRQSLLDPRHLQRFQREARTAAGLHHTNIVPVFGVGQEDDYHYIVMQFICGVGLDQILGQLGQSRSSNATKVAEGHDEILYPRSGRTSEVQNLARALVEGRFQRHSGPGSSKDVGDLLAVHGDETRTSDLAAPSPSQSTSNETLGDSDHVPGTTPVLRSEDGADSTTQRPVLSTSPAYWRSVAGIGLQIGDALEYAHTQGTIHRDIKPANLLVDLKGVVWITDFGLAKAMEQDGVSQDGDVVGTLRYMAPEQLQGEADARSDVYSLGATLYELLTLQPVHSDNDRSSLIRRITQEEPTAPSTINPEIPRDLDTIVLKAISLEPAHRYQSAGDMAGDLQCYLEDRPIRARRTSAAERLLRWCRRNRAVASLAGTALVLLVLVAVTASVGYVRTKTAELKVRDALAGESRERQRAEGTATLALEAVDTIFDLYAPIRTTAASSLAVEGTSGMKIEVPIQPVLSRENAAVLVHMLGFYGRLAAQGGSAPDIRLKIAEANRRVGNIHARLGQFEDATAAYRQSIQLFGEIEAESGTGPTARIERARINNQLGIALVALDRAEEGREFYQKARDILEALQSTSPDSPTVQFELARSCYLLAKAPRRPVASPPGRGRGRGQAPPPGSSRPPSPGANRPSKSHGEPTGEDHSRRPQEGDDPWRTAVDILTELSAVHPEVPDYRHLLALCYRDLPRPLSWSQDQHPSRVDAITQAIEILRQLTADFPDVPKYRFDLSETYARASTRALCPGPDPSVVEEQRLRDALDISKQLVSEQPHMPEYVVSQVHIRLRFANALRRRDQTKGAEEQLQGARILQSGLAQRFPDMPSHQVSVAAIDGALARLLRDGGRLEDALAHLEDALAVLNKLPDDWDRPPYVRDVFVATYMDIANVQRQLGDNSEAAYATHQAERLRKVR